MGTRPGYEPEALAGVLGALEQPDRVRLFEMTPVPSASRELRNRFDEAEVPSGVAEIIRREGLYDH